MAGRWERQCKVLLLRQETEEATTCSERECNGSHGSNLDGADAARRWGVFSLNADARARPHSTHHWRPPFTSFTHLHYDTVPFAHYLKQFVCLLDWTFSSLSFFRKALYYYKKSVKTIVKKSTIDNISIFVSFQRITEKWFLFCATLFSVVAFSLYPRISIHCLRCNFSLVHIDSAWLISWLVNNKSATHVILYLFGTS